MSNRLLQANFQDYLDVLKKYIAFLQNTPIIYEYICNCGQCEQNIEKEVKEVQHGSGRLIFTTGETEQEEVRNIYAILKYISENNLQVQNGIAWGYSSSNKFQDKIKEFNNRFVMILIRHIENFLTNVGIDMGLDDKVVYNVSVQNGQAIIAGDNTTVNATNNIGIDSAQLKELIAKVVENTKGLSPEAREEVNESLEVIEQETKSGKPKKSLLKTAIKTLSAIKGTVEFAAATAALIEFISVII